jgi:hypothetical protein
MNMIQRSRGPEQDHGGDPGAGPGLSALLFRRTTGPIAGARLRVVKE